MVLFISGRTDILSYYPNWLIKRIKEGYVDTRNPYNPNLVSRIHFSNVDIIVFCSKNPRPFLKYLDEVESILKDVPLVFHITLTPYNDDIEPIIGKIKKEVIEDIKYLSSRYGKDRIFLRYDPILKNKKYTIAYHLMAFSKLCELLNGYVSYVVISFIDIYKNVKHNSHVLNLCDINEDEYDLLARVFYNIANKNGMEIFTCGEKKKFLNYGFINGACLSKDYATKLMNSVNKIVKFKKQSNRKNNDCDCVEMVDIGAYNSCLSKCKYCYANYDEKEVNNNYLRHNEDSSLLIGELTKDDVIKERT